jgi:hypothetical protein
VKARERKAEGWTDGLLEEWRQMGVSIATCRVVRVANMTGSVSYDWIY